MAKIIDENCKRRTIRLTTDDVINVVRAYQSATKKAFSYTEIRHALDKLQIYVPEDLF